MITTDIKYVILPTDGFKMGKPFRYIFIKGESPNTGVIYVQVNPDFKTLDVSLQEVQLIFKHTYPDTIALDTKAVTVTVHKSVKDTSVCTYVGYVHDKCMNDFELAGVNIVGHIQKDITWCTTSSTTYLDTNTTDGNIIEVGKDHIIIRTSTTCTRNDASKERSGSLEVYCKICTPVETTDKDGTRYPANTRINSATFNVLRDGVCIAAVQKINKVYKGVRLSTDISDLHIKTPELYYTDLWWTASVIGTTHISYALNGISDKHYRGATSRAWVEAEQNVLLKQLRTQIVEIE